MLPDDFFAENGYAVLRGAIEPQTCRLFEKYALFNRSLAGYYHSAGPVTRDVQDRYSDPFGESILVELQQLIADTVGAELHCAYSYLRIYGPESFLKPHTDRESCEISVTMTVARDPVDARWPVYLRHNDEPVAINLEPGDILIYRGSDLEHWRDDYEGSYWMQLFLHYVTVGGAFDHLKFDGRPVLGHPVQNIVHSRNQPCPCGSERRYKHCHGSVEQRTTQESDA